MDWTDRYASRMSRVVASDIRERMKLLSQRKFIQLGGGLPDPDIFAYDLIAQATARIFADPAKARMALQYASSEGHGPLREWLADYMTSLGAPCGVDNIMITNGSQQALDFVGKLLLDPGDVAMSEKPSFIGALRAFDAYEVTQATLPSTLAEVDPKLKGKVKFAYAGPDFQNPTGRCLTKAQREELLDVAEALDTPILEDGCYERFATTANPYHRFWRYRSRARAVTSRPAA